jgi:hypothetical protein
MGLQMMTLAHIVATSDQTGHCLNVASLTDSIDQRLAAARARRLLALEETRRQHPFDVPDQDAIGK